MIVDEEGIPYVLAWASFRYYPIYIFIIHFIPKYYYHHVLCLNTLYRKDHARAHYRFAKYRYHGTQRISSTGRADGNTHFKCTLGYWFLNYYLQISSRKKQRNLSTDIITDNITDTHVNRGTYTDTYTQLPHLDFYLALVARLYKERTSILCTSFACTLDYCKFTRDSSCFISAYSSESKSKIIALPSGLWRSAKEKRTAFAGI